jgi:hypothetical protein
LFAFKGGYFICSVVKYEFHLSFTHFKLSRCMAEDRLDAAMAAAGGDARQLCDFHETSSLAGIFSRVKRARQKCKS